MRQKTFLMEAYECDLNVEDEVVLVEQRRTDGSSWRAFRHTGHGVPGNTNPSIERYHGWRGTTNNMAVYAHGVRKIVKIQQANDDFIKITVGKDLYPDWE